MTTADNFFGGGARSLSFGKTHDQTWLNRWRGGRVTHIGEPTQQTNIQSGAPLFKPDGSKKMQLPIVLACDGSGQNPACNERTDPSDDGRRTAYVKGTLQFAIGQELDRHGLRLPEIGGELYLRWVGMKNVGEFDGRDWEVKYFRAPAGHNQAAADFMTQGAPAPAPQAPPAAPPAFAQQPSATGFGGQPVGQQPQAPVPAFSGAPAPQAQQPAQPPAADAWGAAPAQQPQAPQNAATPSAPNDPWA